MSFSKGDPAQQPVPSMATIVRGNSVFALELYNQLRTQAGSFCFSPYSLSMAFALLCAGARGATERQMTQVLHLPLGRQFHKPFNLLSAILRNAAKEVTLQISHSLWHQTGHPLLADFLTLVKKQYGGFVAPTNFQQVEVARQEINAWIAQKTERRMKGLIPPGMLDSSVRLILINSIFFKGHWLHQFDPKLTQLEKFEVTPTTVVDAWMMQQNEAFGYLETEDTQIVELPYLGKKLSMLVILPKNRQELGKFEAKLNLKNLNKWKKQLETRRIQVILPRFKISCNFHLKNSLINLGMRDAFNASQANFSGIDGLENSLYITTVFHSTFINVDEEGSEAAAITFLAERETGISNPPIFRADHPFIFLIYEKTTDTILFLGRCMNPVEN